MDAQILAAFEALENDHKLNHPNNFIPDLDYYPALIGSADAVISTLSTFIIEAAMMGKPALAVAFSMVPTQFPLEECIKCEHFKYLHKTKGIVTSLASHDFVENLKRLAALTQRPDLQDLLAEDIRDVVYRDNKSYADRLNASVQNVLGDASISVGNPNEREYSRV